MKKLKLTSVLLIWILSGCVSNQENAERERSREDSVVSTLNDVDPVFIPLSDANEMIQSYLNSIDYMNNDTDLHSLIFSADSVRAYLTDTNISGLKVLFAHTQQFISQRGSGTDAGYLSGGLTLIIAGFDRNGDYRFFANGLALNRAIPCPTNCPGSGTAANDLLVNH